MTLAEYAAQWVDMVPHYRTLTRHARDCSVIIEWGVRGGVSTWALLEGLPEIGVLWSVDTDECIPQVPLRVASDARWHFVKGDDIDPEVRAQIPDRADLIFIDTSHTYEQTTLELGIVLDYAPRKIVMHDVNQSQVRQAVDEFLQRTGWRMTGYEDGWGLATLEP